MCILTLLTQANIFAEVENMSDNSFELWINDIIVFLLFSTDGAGHFTFAGFTVVSQSVRQWPAMSTILLPI